jgi:hypothetical protein
MGTDGQDPKDDGRLARLNLRRRYEQRVGRRVQLQKDLEQVEAAVRSARRQIKIAEQALDIVRAVALQTQQELEYHISQVVTAAEQAVFDERAYTLNIEFVERRGRTECDLFFERDGQRIDPLASAGYGTVDIAALALRAACRTLTPSAAPLLLLDEPYRHIKGGEPNRRAIEMTRELAHQLGLQILMISDERCERAEIAAGADRLFEVSMTAGRSQVSEAG